MDSDPLTGQRRSETNRFLRRFTRQPTAEPSQASEEPARLRPVVGENFLDISMLIEFLFELRPKLLGNLGATSLLLHLTYNIDEVQEII
jgi:hypothetical protein